MTRSELIKYLSTAEELHVLLPTDEFVPKHFHVTEIGKVTKHFMDCGGQSRTTETMNIQLWVASDYYHRLTPEKFLGILDKTSKLFSADEDPQIIVEYQSDSIGLYELDIKNDSLLLRNTHTACLALDLCKVAKTVVNAPKQMASSCCSHGVCC